MSELLPLVRFHEISLSTGDLAASIGFWREQGWTQAQVRPVWPHPYAALSYGALVIGLHEYRFPSPSVTCVHPDIATALEDHRDAGLPGELEDATAQVIRFRAREVAQDDS